MELPQSIVSDISKEAEALALKLKKMFDAHIRPFPYDDIWHIGKTVTSRKIATRRAIAKGFVADLDMYLSDIAGCSSWDRKALTWDSETRRLFAGLMSKEFFEQHPEYLLVRRWITETNTPELFRDFVLHEEMRVNVLALLRLLNELESR